MINLGTDLQTFITSLNAEATIDATLLDVLVDNARAIIEEERSWVVLRKVDKSKTITTASLYTTAIDLSTITDFSRFYSEYPIRLFDGDNRVEYYKIVPFDRQLDYKDVSNTACYDENSKSLFLNGVVPFNGTLYLSYVSTSADIDLTSASAIWTAFPTRFRAILGYYAIGIHAGGVDYDSISARQAPNNLNVMNTLKNAMETWDDSKQNDSLSFNDPTEFAGGFPRSGAINRYD